MVKDNSELEELTQALQQLDLTYAKVRKLLTKEVRRHERAHLDSSQPATTRRIPQSEGLFPGYNFQLNDRVRIKNSKPNQQSVGLIVGRTGSVERGFIKVRTSDGKVINRGPQNLSKV